MPWDHNSRRACGAALYSHLPSWNPSAQPDLAFLVRMILTAWCSLLSEET